MTLNKTRQMRLGLESKERGKINSKSLLGPNDRCKNSFQPFNRSKLGACVLKNFCDISNTFVEITST